MVSRAKYLLESNRYKLCTASKAYIDKIPVDNFEIVQKLLQFNCNII